MFGKIFITQLRNCVMLVTPLISLSRTVSEINGDFGRKSHENRQFFLPPVYLTPPLKGFPLVSAQGSEETRMMGLPDDRKRFKIGLAVFIQYWRVTDSQPPSHVAVASTLYAYRRRAVTNKLTHSSA